MTTYTREEMIAWLEEGERASPETVDRDRAHRAAIAAMLKADGEAFAKIAEIPNPGAPHSLPPPPRPTARGGVDMDGYCETCDFWEAVTFVESAPEKGICNVPLPPGVFTAPASICSVDYQCALYRGPALANPDQGGEG